MTPTFDVIPVIQDRNGVRIGVVVLAGISTRHDSTDTDSGKLYGDIVSLGVGSYRLDLFSDFARSPGSLVATGTAPAVSSYFALDAANDSGVSGRARLEGVGEASKSILIVTFAVDADVFKNLSNAEAMPGYDPDYGLAAFHARAMKQILTSDLPGAVPSLFAGRRLASFTPLDANAEFPDLTVIESPESLTSAQANLVKALSAQEAEHLDEYATMGDAALARYALALQTLKEANTPATSEAAQQQTGFSIGSFTRA